MAVEISSYGCSTRNGLIAYRDDGEDRAPHNGIDDKKKLTQQ